MEVCPLTSSTTARSCDSWWRRGLRVGLLGFSFLGLKDSVLTRPPHPWLIRTYPSGRPGVASFTHSADPGARGLKRTLPLTAMPRRKDPSAKPEAYRRPRAANPGLRAKRERSKEGVPCLELAPRWGGRMASRLHASPRLSPAGRGLRHPRPQVRVTRRRLVSAPSFFLLHSLPRPKDLGVPS